MREDSGCGNADGASARNRAANVAFGGRFTLPIHQPVDRGTEDGSKRQGCLRLESCLAADFDLPGVALAKVGKAIDLASAEVREASKMGEALANGLQHDNDGYHDHHGCQKESADAGKTLGIVREVQTLLERMQWVLESGRVKNANAWSLAAAPFAPHLKIARTTVQMAMARMRKEPTFRPASDVLEALAKAANVSPGWFAFNEGGPDGVEPELLSNRDEGKRQFRRDLSYYRNEAKGRAFLAQLDEARHFAGMADRSPTDWSREYMNAFREWDEKNVGATEVDTPGDGPPIAARRKR